MISLNEVAAMSDIDTAETHEVEEPKHPSPPYEIDGCFDDFIKRSGLVANEDFPSTGERDHFVCTDGDDGLDEA